MHNKRDLVLVSKLSAPYITLCDFYLYIEKIQKYETSKNTTKIFNSAASLPWK